jgi:hypothetical protein
MIPNIEIEVNQIIGYGCPDSYQVLVIYDNHVLEEQTTNSPFLQGQFAERLENKWRVEWDEQAFLQLVAESRLASPICDGCNQPTRNIGKESSYIGAKVFCSACKDVCIPLYRNQLRQEGEERNRKLEEDRIAKQKALHDRIHEILAGAFHWKDNWFFKRQSDGSVRIMKHNSEHYPQYGDGTEVHEFLYPDLVIPDKEWASIVCVVSNLGTTSDRYSKALAFHNYEEAQCKSDNLKPPILKVEY